jgi:glycolate oxidase FAD binding subunit
VSVISQIERACGLAASSCTLPDGRDVPCFEPASEAQSAKLLAQCSAEGWTVLPRGCGSKLARRPLPASIDLVLSSRGLTGILSDDADDGTVTVRAGTLWSELLEVVGSSGNMVYPLLDEPAGATVGGVFAAADPGSSPPQAPRLRDQVLGMTLLLGDGREVRSGGRLVKNVTGYDLHRLLIGSHGTLAFVTSLSLRVHVDRGLRPRSRPVVPPGERRALPGQGLMARIESALDPSGVFPKGRLHAGSAAR